MTRAQQFLFADAPPLPPGMRYQSDIISAGAQRHLLAAIARLAFKPFEFHGYLGKRRIASFGFKYDYGARAVAPAPPIPDFLLPLRQRAADWAELPADELRQAMVTEYAPGAGIGWHRDKAVFGEVIGISLLAPCSLRFRLPVDGGWKRLSLTPEPRSAYLLQGAARTEWYHSIPPVTSLRYSVTFRRRA
jgi:alkylated DNA repair dioxygenase AlkB